MERSRELPLDIAPVIAETESICRAFLSALSFMVADTARDPGYIDNHLLSYLSQDFLQSTISLPLLVQEGIHNVCRRELRFVLEASIKVCYIQQQQYNSDVTTKLTSFESVLKDTNISIQKQLNLNLLPEIGRASFYQEVGRIYGETSKYVHLTQPQILERIALVDQGRTSGRESTADVQTLNRLISRGLACSLVFLLHSVPEYVPGDLLVKIDGSSLNWHFAQSKFIALIDQHFDYKHERQVHLATIKDMRQARVIF